ncbi:MAG: hypothetical protein U0984_11135, partial [Prosthecobacter sp.]|nr:hypothetical protein [Prosthecobacter sp.]
PFAAPSKAAAPLTIPTASGVSPARGNLPAVPAAAYDRIAQQCRAIFAIEDAAKRKAAFETLVRATTDVTGLKAIVETMLWLSLASDHVSDPAEFDSFWDILAKRDVNTAVSLIESCPVLWHTDAASKVMREWAAKDPLAAMRWLQGAERLTGHSLDEATLSLIRGYASRDLKAATAYALSIVKPDEGFFNRVSTELTGDIVQKSGTEGLLAWFAALPEGPAKQEIFNIVGARLGKLNPTQMRQWLDAEAGNSHRNDETYRVFIAQMAKTDPRAAMDYALNLPPSPHQPGAFVGVGSASFEWLARDRAAFANYYQSLPVGVQREAIVKALQEALNDPDLPIKKGLPALWFIEGLR